MTDFKYKVTLFTPTYNRAHLLPRLYESVKRQTFKDFEWIIVDDGSTDGTEELVNNWLKDDNFFPISFYKRKNGGKARAINFGLDIAQGELFFIMDSDDYLTDNALERAVYWEGTLPKNEKFCGVVGNRGNSETYSPNRPLGAEYKDDFAYIRYPEYTKNYLDGEHAGVWYTEIHRKYKYPEFDGENYMDLCVSWNRMAHDGYKVRIFDEIIWVWEYMDDGLTKQGTSRYIKNPRQHGLTQKEKAEFLNYSLKQKVNMWYTYYCDHSFCEEKYRLTKKQCAEYIGAPYLFICASAALHKSGFIKKIIKR